MALHFERGVARCPALGQPAGGTGDRARDVARGCSRARRGRSRRRWPRRSRCSPRRCWSTSSGSRTRAGRDADLGGRAPRLSPARDRRGLGSFLAVRARSRASALAPDQCGCEPPRPRDDALASARRSLRASAPAAAIAGGIPATPRYRQRAAGEVRVSFLDIGQGDATLIELDGTTVLVDTGPPDGPILTRLEEAGVKRFDALMLPTPRRITRARPRRSSSGPAAADRDGGAGWSSRVHGCSRSRRDAARRAG